jgi:hypothetical protein
MQKELKNDLAGKRFGRIVVTGRAPNRNGRVAYHCHCDCGSDFITLGQHLAGGRTKSCGCLNRELAAKRMKVQATTHGESKTPLYVMWKGMRKRCANPHYPRYDIYGGKGISVCDEWNDFPTFKRWAMSHGYEKGLSLDRINGNLGYCPSNCRWADAVTQNNNSSQNHLVTYQGETKTLAQWCREINIPYYRTKKRIYTGWSTEDAFCLPYQRLRRRRT